MRAWRDCKIVSGQYKMLQMQVTFTYGTPPRGFSDTQGAQTWSELSPSNMSRSIFGARLKLELELSLRSHECQDCINGSIRFISKTQSVLIPCRRSIVELTLAICLTRGGVADCTVLPERSHTERRHPQVPLALALFYIRITILVFSYFIIVRVVHVLVNSLCRCDRIIFEI